VNPINDNDTVLQVTPEALPKFHRQIKLMISLAPIRPRTPTVAAQIPQVNVINDKSCPNSTTNIHSSSGYDGGAAQIPQANKINDKSCPNLTTNIHHPSSYAGGAVQIPQANNINDNSSPNLTKNIHNCSAG